MIDQSNRIMIPGRRPLRRFPAPSSISSITRRYFFPVADHRRAQGRLAHFAPCLGLSPQLNNSGQSQRIQLMGLSSAFWKSISAWQGCSCVALGSVFSGEGWR